ncbi:MAG: FAD-dependent oxidoreductase [Cloacibacillus evryensis]
MKPTCDVTVAGGGLAGSEAAWQLAERGVRVRICEMRPLKMTPAHETPLLGELVCSNSLGGDRPTTPAGILKAELKRMGSLIMRCAEASRVPAGNALAVDREVFAHLIDSSVANHPNIELAREELTEIPRGAGDNRHGAASLSAPMARVLAALTGEDFLILRRGRADRRRKHRWI